MVTNKNKLKKARKNRKQTSNQKLKIAVKTGQQQYYRQKFKIKQKNAKLRKN